MKTLGAADPTAIGPYRLIGVLGGGGMGRVYLARSSTGRRLAIKIVRAELAEDPVFRRRFAREVAAVRAVNPLFTAAVVDADTDAEQPWLATTYIDGPSLYQWVVRHGPLAPGAVLTLAARLAEALASIHALGLVHRDLKPGNVLVDDDGPHIIDFGVAVATEATRLTTSHLYGTPSYMAPERLRGDDAAPPADVFSLGATLAFAATGKSLIKDGTVYQQVVQITSGRLDLSAVPAQLRPLITRCVSYRPRDRPTAKELARILVGAGAAAPTPGWLETSATEPAVVAVEEHQTAGLSRRRMVALGGALGLALAGAGVGTTAAVSGIRREARASESPSPGSILWQGTSRGAGDSVPPGVIVAGDNRLITANGADVRAVDRTGRTVWTRTLPSRLLDVRLWGDAVLASDARRLWLLDSTTGGRRFAVNAADAEEVASRPDNPDNLQVEIYGIAVSAERAFLNLGTAMIAVDRGGRQAWRTPRPAPRDGRRPTASNPLAADPVSLVTEDLVNSSVEVGAYDAATGARRWSTYFDSASPRQQPPPPPGGRRPPPDAPPPPPDDGPSDGGPGGRPPDEAWQRSEARIGSGYVALRNGQEIQVLRISDGRTAWRLSAPRPVAAIELVGDLLVVAADRLTGYAVATGAQVWQSGLRGARIAIQPDLHGIVAATEDTISGLDLAGATRWQTPLPDAVRKGLPHRLTAAGQAAFLTFGPHPDRSGPLDVDVLAVSLGRHR
jgi:outer membrane protein assembly factor BamB